MKVKKYQKEDLTIVWKPEVCIHSAICAKGLPSVFKPTERPWIQPEGAAKQEIMDRIDKCPSGALSYLTGEGQEEEEEKIISGQKTEVQVKSNGPLLVSGNLLVKNSDGSEETKKRVTAFCRCGASNNKPYCDGAHNEVGFQG